MKRKLPTYFYNPVTFTGTAIALVTFGLILFLIVLDFLAAEQKPYMGIITFVLMPGILIFGLGLIAYGGWRQRKRLLAGTAKEYTFPRIDLNDPAQFRAFSIFAGGTLLLILFSAFGSYKAYEYTESDAFCGTMCHTVMLPEYTAYQNSPHARVGCVKCHIGPGAGWFVKSKLSGAYQVYAVLANVYPKPIGTPIKNLRPAQETCEQCHWPQHFFSEKHVSNTYFIADKDNTKWTLNLLLKVGGGNPEAGITTGIHWHMNIANEITYAASDEKRQVIPWVKSKGRDGTETVYKSTEASLTDEQLAGLEHRRMDCIDCHNRPSHRYLPATQTIDHVMSLGWIDRTLPFAKSIAMRALETPYTSTPNAVDSIALIVREFYAADHPETARTRKAEIDRMVSELQKIYQRNFFPEMHVSWREFPHNIGHMFAPGCFRCHDGKHVSSEGKVLTRDCNTCHTILAQQYERQNQQVSMTGIGYQHPVDIGDAWKEMNCSDCHTNQQ